jgi:predicted DsbA family dithiol-disulfide isomerase
VAAQKQGKFWEFHDKVFANQSNLKKDAFVQYAKEVGLDVGRFEEDLYSPAPKAAVDADIAEAKALGVTGTPAFFVNGHYISGAKPFEEFAEVINSELTRLKLPVPSAAQPAAKAAGG